MQVALMVGLSMAQIGEFSFVLLEAGSSSGLVSQSWYQYLISSAVATMALTPLFFWASRTLLAHSRAASLLRRFGTLSRIRELDSAAGTMHDHVLICGFGVTGRNITTVLRANKIPYVILELNPSTIRQERLNGEPIFFGDCTDEGILRHAGIMRARIIVLAISDPLATRVAVRVSRLLNPELVILTRSKYLSEIDGLLDLGANEVISEEFESSFELLARILRVYHFPRQLVAQEIKSIRDARYGVFRHADTTVPRLRLSTRLDVYIETFKMEPGSPVCGRPISETGLRQESGALVLGIIREPETLNNPDPSVVLEPGDFLVMSGTKDQLKRAMEMLSGKN
jgi:CPA2 family monovalent cation:H+ antiporter-2